MFQFLANGSQSNHAHQLKAWIGESRSVFVSVAFLKHTGLGHVLPALRRVLETGGHVAAVIGTDFRLTDPEALQSLFDLHHEYRSTCSLAIFKTSRSSTFHPKYYRCTTTDRLRVIIGSANLTGGGLEKNVELTYEKLVGGKQGEKLWHSGSLARSKNLIIPQHEKMQGMIREISANQERSPGDIFAVGRRWIEQIEHLGPNVFTEICHTFQPKRFAVLNNNPKESLKYLGLGAFGSTQAFTPAEYVKFCAVLGELRDQCGFEDFGRTDHFLNYVYWIRPKETKSPSAAEDASES